jgi:hypothetical protein
MKKLKFTLDSSTAPLNKEKNYNLVKENSLMKDAKKLSK